MQKPPSGVLIAKEQLITIIFSKDTTSISGTTQDWVCAYTAEFPEIKCTNCFVERHHTDGQSFRAEGYCLHRLIVLWIQITRSGYDKLSRDGKRQNQLPAEERRLGDGCRTQPTMLKYPIMLCCTAPKIFLLCSTNAPIVLKLCSSNHAHYM